MAPGKKNARRRKAWIFFQDESGVSQRPSIRRTWAPRGETPQKDGKLYIMDYGASYRSLIGVHGPYNSLEDYKKFLERNGPPELKILSVTFGWPKSMGKSPGFRLEY